jgi:hypothetical protein
MDYKQERLFVLAIVQGARLQKKLPLFVKDAIELYSDACGDITWKDTEKRVKEDLRINQ